MKGTIAELDGSNFDVAIIGAGINGCAAAQEAGVAGRACVIDVTL